MNSDNKLHLIILLLILVIIYYYTLSLMKPTHTIEKFTVDTINNYTKTYYGLPCEYEKKDSFYEILEDLGYTVTHDIKKASLIVPCTYDKLESELKQINESGIKQNINGDQVKIYYLHNTDNIVSKILLWKILHGIYGINTALSFAPMTWDLHEKEDYNHFIDYFNKNKGLYILKNNNQRQEGLKIINSLEEITQNKIDYLLVQELLQNPYLIRKRKINLRVYCLVVKDNDKKYSVYIYKDGFMYYTPEYFEKNSIDFKKNITTGYIDRQVYEENPLTHQDFRDYLDSERELTEIEKYIRKNGIMLSEYIFSQIYILLKYVLRAYADHIGKDSYGVNFQIYGADIAINDHLQPQIMELNKGPDMKAKDGRDKQLKKSLSHDILKVIGLEKDKNNNFIKVYEKIKVGNEYVNVDYI